MSQNLKDLLARIEGATEGSRDLDVALHHAFGPPLPLEYWAESDTVPYENTSWAKPFTTSIDAALSLVYRLLPEWGHTIIQGIYETPRAWLTAPDEGGHGDFSAATMPLTIIGSLLTTLIYQEPPLASQPADQTRQGEP